MSANQACGDPRARTPGERAGGAGARAAQAAMMVERARRQVIKTLAPGERGAIELARRHGDTVVRRRHWADAKGKLRHAPGGQAASQATLVCMT